LCSKFKTRVKEVLGREFPDDPMENPEILLKANGILHKQEHDMLSKEPSIKIFSLTPTEFRLLVALMEQPGKVV